tara:strand:- start:9244 stop:9828 length:585 start_codon:yes stop_codon:yes gene_type:complete
LSIQKVAQALLKTAKRVHLDSTGFRDRAEQGDILWQFNFNRDRYEKARDQSYEKLRKFEHEGLILDQKTGVIYTSKRQTPFALGTTKPKATRVASLPDIRKLNTQLGRRINTYNLEGSLSMILAKEVDPIFEKEGFYLDIQAWPTWLIGKKAHQTYPIRVKQKGGKRTEMEFMLRWEGPFKDGTYTVRGMVRHL